MFQRLLLIIFSLFFVASAIFLILINSQKNLVFFYTPSELLESNIDKNKQVRIGGFVEKNTFIKVSAGSFKFIITDNIKSINVTYTGILPDLFREGQGAVIEGYVIGQNSFNAKNIFAKHDENYMPASIKDDLENKGYWNKNYK